jgi:hypothetical protein
MSHRNMIGTLIRGAALAIATLPIALVVYGASDTRGLVSLSLRGVGSGSVSNGSCSTIACKTGDTCVCLASAYSLLGNQGFKGGSFTLQLSIDTTATTDLPISDTGSCNPATGSGTIASKNGRQTVTVQVSGLECPSTSSTTPDVFNLAYVVTGGTGKYSSSSGGAGTVNGSQVLNSGAAQVLISGGLQPVASAATPSPTATPTRTATPTPTATATPTPTPTATPTATPSPA